MVGSRQIPAEEQDRCPECWHYPCSVQRDDDPYNHGQVEATVTCPCCLDSRVTYNANPIEMVVGDE